MPWHLKTHDCVHARMSCMNWDISRVRLGRGKVLVLRKGDIEIPSDLAGVLYTELDEHGGWKRKLLSELTYAVFF
ncbi:nucleotide-binding protein [Klebsiella pneumoniae]|uniref:Nucleotide-binding protein n=1 Tax=Klebsiella pneumoniae TaxID=573 RepID=A0A2X3BPD8_KLEPN|nr:nucleotide-binding protein [Klebsiella pneumoniae]